MSDVSSPRGTLNIFQVTEAEMRRRRLQRGEVYRSGETWRVRYRVDCTDGVTVTRKRMSRLVGIAVGDGKITKREAERLAWELFVSKADQQSLHPGAMMTLAAFVEQRFLPDRIADPEAKPTGISFLKSILNTWILPSLGTMELRSINTAHIQVTMGAAKAAGKSMQTVRHIKNVSSLVLKYAKRLNFITGDLPTDAIKKIIVAPKERQALTWREVLDLAALMEEPLGLLILLLTTTGLRISEAMGLCWECVNLEPIPFQAVNKKALAPRSITVQEGYVRGRYQTPKTRSSYRDVPIPGWLAEMLAVHKAHSRFRAPEDPVFTSSTGRPLDQHNVAARKLKPAAESIGMGWVSWHIFRHTNATLAAQHGFTDTERQRILGHSNTEITKHYTHANLEVSREKMERMDRPN